MKNPTEQQIDDAMLKASVTRVEGRFLGKAVMRCGKEIITHMLPTHSQARTRINDLVAKELEMYP